LEWTVFAVSLVLVASTLAYLTFDAVTAPPTPPRLEIRLGKAQPITVGGIKQFAVPVTVVNHGMMTAESVEISVTLQRKGEEPEEAGFTIPFLPRQSTRHGTVTFSADPRSGRLESRIPGYEEP